MKTSLYNQRCLIYTCHLSSTIIYTYLWSKSYLSKGFSRYTSSKITENLNKYQYATIFFIFFEEESLPVSIGKVNYWWGGVIQIFLIQMFYTITYNRLANLINTFDLSLILGLGKSWSNIQNGVYLWLNLVLSPNLAIFSKKKYPLWWFREIFQYGRHFRSKFWDIF